MRWTLGDLVRRPQSVPLRKFLFQVHLWLGLCVGLYVFAIGLSGAMLVFRPELQARAFPQFFHTAYRTEAGASTQSLLNSLTVAYPGERLSGLDWPTQDTRRTVGDAVMASVGWLHVGGFDSVALRSLWAIFALSLPTLFVTGSLIWWNRVMRRS